MAGLFLARRNELGQTPDFEHTGLAMRLELGGVEIGPGKASVQALGSTGGNPASRNNSEFRTVAQSARDNFGAQGYWSYLVITSPHGPSDVTDLGLSLQNRGLGLYTVQAKYEYPVTHRLSGLLAAGWFGSAERNPTSNARGIGTELAKQFTYDFGGGLKLDLGAAYLFTGDFYKTGPAVPSPNNLWEVFTRLQLEF